MLRLPAMRLVPAAAGTLMVPAMYFLARQLVSRRAALLTAAFTATSAWLMVFSHDAKMYSHFWLFLVLHVACLLWWMRTGRRIPFWCTVAAGCAMAGLHATGLIALPLDAVLFLAHPRTTWRRALPFTLAVLLIAAGPAGYYLGFNRFSNAVQSDWNWSGIQWIEQRNQGHSTPKLLADTAAAHLFAFNFVSESMFHSTPPGPTPHPILIAAWTTLAVAEHFRDKGLNVLCLMDSVTRFAMAQREIGLASGEPPATKGYTPTVFAELPHLLERAGPGAPGSGMITGLFTVLVDGDDHNEPVADAVRGILDGHIVMRRAIAERGRYPAINILKSISRTMPRAADPDFVPVIARARQVMATYSDMEELIRLGAYRQGSSPEVDEAIGLHKPLEAFLGQAKEESTSLGDGYRRLQAILAGAETEN